MIVINENDFGLNDLAGLALTYTRGVDLPNDLYVYGLQDGNRPYSVYIDPRMPYAEHIHCFIERNVGVPSTIGLPTRPRMRPAIGLTRTFRDADHIEQATRIAVFACFAINNKIRFTGPSWDVRVGDLVHYNNMLCEVLSVEPDGVTLRIHLTGGVVLGPDLRTPRIIRWADIQPVYPDQVGQRARPIRDRPTYGNGTYILPLLTVGHVGQVVQVEPDRTYLQVEHNDPYDRPVYLDPTQLIRVA